MGLQQLKKHQIVCSRAPRIVHSRVWHSDSSIIAAQPDRRPISGEIIKFSWPTELPNFLGRVHLAKAPKDDLSDVADIDPWLQNRNAMWVLKRGLRHFYFKVANFHGLRPAHSIHGSLSNNRTYLTQSGSAKIRHATVRRIGDELVST